MSSRLVRLAWQGRRAGAPLSPDCAASPVRTSARPARAAALALSLLCAAALPACGGVEAAPDDPPVVEKPGTVQRPQLGEPFTATQDTWTWIDFPEAVCDDGTPTGIGVNLRPGSKNVLVYLQGGGACWDYLTCAVLNSATHGPYGRVQFDGQKGRLGGSILDRAGSSPYADWNLVYVPYCTGDVHAGDNVMTYDGGLDKRVIRHKGRANIVAYLRRLAATLPDAEQLVLSGSSAGGFGAALNYDVFRTYFPAARSYLLDDSGPPLVGDAIPADLRSAWWRSWRLGATLGPICAACESDFSALVPILMQRYPQDRMALLSYTQDTVIRSFFGFQSPMQFQQNLLDMTGQRLGGGQFGYYYVTGDGHTFLGAPEKTVSQNVKLSDWLRAFASDGESWKPVTPVSP